MRRSLLAPLSALTLSLAAACGTGGTLAPSEVSALRIFNGSPDSPPADFFLRGGQIQQAVPYANGRFYIFINPGTNQLLEARDNITDEVLLDYTASFTNGTAYTFAMIGIAGSRQGVLFTDDTSAAPAGNFKVRVLNLARLGPAVDLYITDPNTDLNTVQPVATGLAYPTASAAFTAPIGTKVIRLTETGTKTVLCSTSTTQPINFTTGQSVSQFVTGAAGAAGGGAPYTCPLVADHS